MKFFVAKPICLLVFIFLLNVTGLGAATLLGKVIGVSDGDTIMLLDSESRQHKIRLTGIDAPEKAQPFGQRSKEHLSRQVFGKRVSIEYSKTDRYGRTLGKVLVDGVDVNLEQVKNGFAWHYKEYMMDQSVMDRNVYAAAEASAHSAGVGLWKDKNPTPPWDWRHGGKNLPTEKNSASGCPCDEVTMCTGKRGGQYCVMPNGKKRYLHS